jgi:uncharacterized membrane protein
MTETPSPSTSGAVQMRWPLRLLLIASLTLNFLMIGLAIGAVIAGPHGRRPPSMELDLGPFASALDREDRRAIAREMMGRHDERAFSRRDREEMMRALVDALRAEPFSPDRLRNLIEDQREVVQAAQGRALDAVLGRIIAMSPESRLAFADRLAGNLGSSSEGP